MSRQRRIGSRWRKAMAAGVLAIASAVAMFVPSVSISAPNDSFEYFSDLKKKLDAQSRYFNAE